MTAKREGGLLRLKCSIVQFQRYRASSCNFDPVSAVSLEPFRGKLDLSIVTCGRSDLLDIVKKELDEVRVEVIPLTKR